VVKELAAKSRAFQAGLRNKLAQGIPRADMQHIVQFIHKVTAV